MEIKVKHMPSENENKNIIDNDERIKIIKNRMLSEKKSERTKVKDKL